MKYLIFILFSFPIMAIENGNLIKAEALNSHFSQAKERRICILKEKRKNNFVDYLSYPSSSNVFRRFSHMEGDCDFISQGTSVANSQYDGDSYFDSFTLAEGEYIVNLFGVGSHNGGYQELSLTLNGVTKIYSNYGYTSGAADWGELTPRMGGMGLLTVPSPGQEVRVNYYSNFANTSLHPNGNYQTNHLILKIEER